MDMMNSMEALLLDVVQSGIKLKPVGKTAAAAEIAQLRRASVKRTGADRSSLVMQTGVDHDQGHAVDGPGAYHSAAAAAAGATMGLPSSVESTMVDSELYRNKMLLRLRREFETMKSRSLSLKTGWL